MPSTLSDNVIYPDLIHGAFVEKVREVVEIFNAASANTMRLTSGSALGFEQRESFFETIDTVHRRDHANLDNDVTVNAVNTDEWLRPTVLRAVTLKAYDLLLWLQGRDWDPETLSMMMGEKFALDTLKDRCDTGLEALIAAMDSETDMKHGDGSNKFDYKKLNQGLAKLGDRRDEVGMLVMHSVTYADIIDHSVEEKFDGLTGVTIREGSPATLGLPVLVTDNTNLHVEQSPGDDHYRILALRPSALTLTDLLTPTWEFDKDIVTHGQAMTVRGNLHYQIDVLGFAFDGDKNPASGTSSNQLGDDGSWDYKMDSVKSGPGVMITVEQGHDT